jgi:hypothetical protein
MQSATHPSLASLFALCPVMFDNQANQPPIHPLRRRGGNLE